MKRCEWVTKDQLYIDYHDTVWGVPLYNDIKLFEMILLEGAQAGLSWFTILKRQAGYFSAYDNFDPEIIANWSEEKLLSLQNDPRIIRNKLKIKSARTNARAFLGLLERHDSFHKYIWSFVDYKQIINNWEDLSQIPATTSISNDLSKSLKKAGFTFVGPTICYAFMQAVGMVNDHTIDCFRYEEINNLPIKLF